MKRIKKNKMLLDETKKKLKKKKNKVQVNHINSG